MSTTAVLRRFNRTYTQRIGVLEESFLGTGRPLAVSRLLFEIGATDRREDGVTARDLRERLDLDSGHLSRMLRRLESDGLATTAPDPADQRRRVVRLTEAGHAARQELDERSEELADRIVAPLTDRQRDRLTAALATADLLVRAATVRLREVPPDDPAGRTALGHYLAEIDARFPTGYQPAGPVAAAASGPGSTYVLATSDGEPVAYGGLRPAPALDEHTVEIKRMWVHGDWRGAGLGSRMLRHLEALARERGCTRLVLDTNEVLAEAIAMYERSGYRAIDRYPGSDPHATHFFEKAVSPDLGQRVPVGDDGRELAGGPQRQLVVVVRVTGQRVGAGGDHPATGGPVGEVPDVARDRAAAALVGDRRVGHAAPDAVGVAGQRQPREGVVVVVGQQAEPVDRVGDVGLAPRRRRRRSRRPRPARPARARRGRCRTAGDPPSSRWRDAGATARSGRSR